jgi:L-alanine-DL-glutamate epimerase-like enolase superfamily enzyme
MMARRLEDLNLFWLEEPIRADDVSGHALLAGQINVPLAIGESLYNKYQFNEYFRVNAVGFVQADVLRVGGITEWMKIARLAESFNLWMAPHYNMEISAQVAAAIPNALMLEYLDSVHFSDLGLLDTPLYPKHGKVRLPDIPGNGLQFNERALKEYQVL